MEKIITYCDKCNKEMNENEFISFILLPAFGLPERKYHICKEDYMKAIEGLAKIFNLSL